MSDIISEIDAMVRHAQEQETPLCAVRTSHLSELVDAATQMEAALLSILFDPGPGVGSNQDRFPALVAYRALGGRVEAGWMVDRERLRARWARHQAQLQLNAEDAQREGAPP